jgi:hypothetical protein
MAVRALGVVQEEPCSCLQVTPGHAWLCPHTLLSYLPAILSTVCVQVLIDLKQVESGSLYDDFEMLAPKKIKVRVNLLLCLHFFLLCGDTNVRM